MKQSKLDIPHIKDQIVKGTAAGTSQTNLSQQLGFSQSTISKFIDRKDIRNLIEREQTKLLEAVPDAVENVKALVKGMKDLPADDSKGKELAYKASKDVLKSVRILPSPVHSQTNISLIEQNTQIISSTFMKMLMKKADEEMTMPDDVILEHESQSNGE